LRRRHRLPVPLRSARPATRQPPAPGAGGAQDRAEPGQRELRGRIPDAHDPFLRQYRPEGQSGSAGGYFKFEQPNGKVSCLFRGSAGSSTASSGAVRVNDGRWHVVRCERTSSSVTMTVDGAVMGRNRNPTGTIANTRPLTIAGKLNCDQVNTTCDYFAGDLHYLQIETS
jgi:Laminin G domain